MKSFEIEFTEEQGDDLAKILMLGIKQFAERDLPIPGVAMSLFFTLMAPVKEVPAAAATPPPIPKPTTYHGIKQSKLARLKEYNRKYNKARHQWLQMKKAKKLPKGMTLSQYREKTGM